MEEREGKEKERDMEERTGKEGICPLMLM